MKSPIQVDQVISKPICIGSLFKLIREFIDSMCWHSLLFKTIIKQKVISVDKCDFVIGGKR